MKCIYCLEIKSDNSFTKAEHVLPQAFGLFQNNFTLTGVVCDECNQYFGDKLEIDLGRDTFEGISRYKYGIQRPKDFKTLGKRSRFRIKVAEGPVKGSLSYLEYSQKLNTVVIKPLPQVGFLNKGSLNYNYFLLEEIPNKTDLEIQGLNYSSNVRALGNDFEEIQRALANKGIHPEFQTEIVFTKEESDTWLVEVEGSIDKTIYRAIAKTAFNYLAYWQGSDFVLQEIFDSIRHYIRKGKQERDPFVMVRNQNILADESSQESIRLAHIITVNWAQDDTTIISQVSLFNILSYTVQLARNYTSEKSNLRKGHFFNLGDHKIFELTAK